LLLETLSSALAQVDERVEIVVVDGASTDGTQRAMRRLAATDCRVRYFRESENGGIDRDYDKAVTYAIGTYCWLVSDDDLFLPDAIAQVLAAMADTPSVIIVDAQVRDARQSKLLLERRLELHAERVFGTSELEPLFLATGRQLSFIGAAIVQRSVWLSRQREAYFGSNFVHVGVIFQEPLPHGARVLTQPCLSIRYGNASWTARAFEIWTFLWPALVWSLPTISESAKRSVVRERPYESIRELVLFRSKGAYSWVEYRRWVAPGPSSRARKLLCAAVAVLPGAMLNLLAITYVLTFSRAPRFALVDLIRSPNFPFKFLRRAGCKTRAESHTA
jgi:glycosyltransferase involved in cell wall biosynthesis